MSSKKPCSVEKGEESYHNSSSNGVKSSKKPCSVEKGEGSNLNSSFNGTISSKRPSHWFDGSNKLCSVVWRRHDHDGHRTVVENVVADTAHERATHGVQTTRTHNYHCSLFLLGYFADYVGRLARF